MAVAQMAMTARYFLILMVAKVMKIINIRKFFCFFAEILVISAFFRTFVDHGVGSSDHFANF